MVEFGMSESISLLLHSLDHGSIFLHHDSSVRILVGNLGKHPLLHSQEISLGFDFFERGLLLVFLVGETQLLLVVPHVVSVAHYSSAGELKLPVWHHSRLSQSIYLFVGGDVFDAGLFHTFWYIFPTAIIIISLSGLLGSVGMLHGLLAVTFDGVEKGAVSFNGLDMLILLFELLSHFEVKFSEVVEFFVLLEVIRVHKAVLCIDHMLLDGSATLKSLLYRIRPS